MNVSRPPYVKPLSMLFEDGEVRPAIRAHKHLHTHSVPTARRNHPSSLTRSLGLQVRSLLEAARRSMCDALNAEKSSRYESPVSARHNNKGGAGARPTKLAL